MIQLPLYVSGNGALFQECLHAISSTMGNPSYASLLKMVILLAGTWALILAIMQRNLMLHVRWLIMYLILIHLFFIPQARMNIIDRQAPGNVMLVEHVPLGLAILASYTTRIGEGLTELLEAQFTLPDYQPYSQTGMVMAAQLMQQSTQLPPPDPAFAADLSAFIHQCVFYDLWLGKYTLSTLIHDPHLWELVTAHASPARAFRYHRHIITCQAGAKKLTQDWDKSLQASSTFLGKRLFPSHPTPAQALLTQLPQSYAFLSHIAQTAPQILQQNLMINALRDAAQHPAQALATYALSKAQMHKRIANATIGAMAAHWLPLMRNAFEAILLGAFVMVFLMGLFPLGTSILKNYALSLFWLQLWSPLYAIINLIVSYYAQVKNVPIFAGSLTLANQGTLAQINADMVGMAGYLSISVPFLSAGLIKGTMSTFVQMAQYIGGVTQSTALGAAGEAQSGNISLGNTSLMNTQAFNTQAHHIDTNTRIQTGMISTQLASGSHLHTTPDNGVVLDGRGALSTLSTNVNIADALRNTYTQEADQSLTASHTQSHASAQQYAAGLRTLDDFGKTHTHQQGSGNTDTNTHSAHFQQASVHMHQLVERFAQEHGISHNVASQLLGEVYGNVQAGVSASIGGLSLPGMEIPKVSLSGKVGLRGAYNLSSTHSNQHLTQAAQQFVQDHHFNQVLDSAERASHDSHYRTSNEDTNRAMHGFNNYFDRGETLRKESAASLQDAHSYRERAHWSEEHASSINTNNTQAFFDWLQTPQGGNLTATDIDTMQSHHPEQLQAYGKRFAHEKADLLHDQWEKEHNQAQIHQQDHQNQQHIATEQDIIRQAASYKEINQGNEQPAVDTRTKEHVNAMINHTQQVLAHDQKLSAKEEQLKAAVQEKTEEK